MCNKFAGSRSWVKWVAQDADGAVWGYEVEPLQHSSGWYENEIGRVILLDNKPANLDWKNSLQRL
ncbi:MAG: hypothetical protein V3W04_12280 [Gammaproteobacteria bacterium]